MNNIPKKRNIDIELNPIEYEAKKLSSREEELLKKARDLENEMK